MPGGAAIDRRNTLIAFGIVGFIILCFARYIIYKEKQANLTKLRSDVHDLQRRVKNVEQRIYSDN